MIRNIINIRAVVTIIRTLPRLYELIKAYNIMLSSPFHSLGGLLFRQTIDLGLLILFAILCAETVHLMNGFTINLAISFEPILLTTDGISSNTADSWFFGKERLGVSLTKLECYALFGLTIMVLIMAGHSYFFPSLYIGPPGFQIKPVLGLLGQDKDFQANLTYRLAEVGYSKDSLHMRPLSSMLDDACNVMNTLMRTDPRFHQRYQESMQECFDKSDFKEALEKFKNLKIEDPFELGEQFMHIQNRLFKYLWLLSPTFFSSDKCFNFYFPNNTYTAESWERLTNDFGKLGICFLSNTLDF